MIVWLRFLSPLNWSIIMPAPLITPEHRELAADREIWQAQFPKGHVIAANQFDPDSLRVVMNHANRARSTLAYGGGQSLHGQTVAVQFGEPSTRTFNSFMKAVKALGGETISTQNAAEYSSAKKGESIQDNIRTLESYCDALIMRDKADDWAERASEVATFPILNGGAGKAEHPTQALLDLYTIRNELSRLDDLTVVMVGDLRFGRTIQSLARLLKFYQVEMRFVAPDLLKIPQDLRSELTEAKVDFEETDDLRSALQDADVFYVTRLQSERIKDPTEKAEIESRFPDFTIPLDVYELGAPNMIGMHPLPRLGELPKELDECAGSAWFRQMFNGLLVRMALLDLVAGKH